MPFRTFYLHPKDSQFWDELLLSSGLDLTHEGIMKPECRGRGCTSCTGFSSSFLFLVLVTSWFLSNQAGQVLATRGTWHLLYKVSALWSQQVVSWGFQTSTTKRNQDHPKQTLPWSPECPEIMSHNEPHDYSILAVPATFCTVPFIFSEPGES